MNRWIERWHGSGPDRGWSIWQMTTSTHGDRVAYVGEGEHSERLTTMIVQKHNDSLAAASEAPATAVVQVPQGVDVQGRRIAAEAENHACSLAVWMTRMDAESPDADDLGVSGWLQEAETRIKRRMLAAAPEAPAQESTHVYEDVPSQRPVGDRSAPVQQPQEAQTVPQHDAVSPNEAAYSTGTDAGETDALVGHAVQPGPAVLSAPEAPAQGDPLEKLTRIQEELGLYNDKPARADMGNPISVPAPWREAVKVAREALKEIADDYADRFDLDSPSTNPGIKSTIKQARDALAQLDALEGGE